MTTNLFSSYRQGENRVTATFMAVLQRLSLPNINRILGALLEEEFSLVSFDNQKKAKASVPDAKIETGDSIWIETKTRRNAVRADQINAHMRGLGPSERLMLLTPDGNRPRVISDSVVWSSFNDLAGIIEDILNDEDSPPSEGEAFLLREFRLMLQEDGLLDVPEDRVIVRPARMAWPMYKDLGVYTCRENELLKRSGHMAFYTNKAIQVLVPQIIAIIPSIVMVNKGKWPDTLEDYTKDLAQKLYARLGLDQIDHIDKIYHVELTQPHTVVFLSGPSDPETITLDQPIKHERRGAWQQGGSRYVTLESLRNAHTTEDLIRA